MTAPSSCIDAARQQRDQAGQARRQLRVADRRSHGQLQQSLHGRRARLVGLRRRHGSLSRSIEVDVVKHTYAKHDSYTVKLTLQNLLGEENDRSAIVKLDSTTTAGLEIMSFDWSVHADQRVPAVYRLLARSRRRRVRSFARRRTADGDSRCSESGTLRHVQRNGQLHRAAHRGQRQASRRKDGDGFRPAGTTRPIRWRSYV